MKTIELKNGKGKVYLKGEQVEVDVKTTQLLKEVINQPVQGGYSMNDMFVRLKLMRLIEDSIKENSEIISFEDADYEQLKVMAKNSKWSVLSEDVIEFLKTFE